MSTRERPADFVTWLLESPGIHSQFKTGLLGLYTMYLFGVAPQAISQMCDEAVSHSLLLNPTSPDDALREVGRARLLPQYNRETLDAYRERLYDAWSLWQRAGSTESVITEQLKWAGWDDAVVRFSLPGGMNSERLIGTLEYAGGNNELRTVSGPYPPSSAWWSQFNVILYTSRPRLAKPQDIKLRSGSNETLTSRFVTQADFDTALLIIKKFKAADFICREVRFINTLTAQLYWGKPGLTWSEPDLVWQPLIDTEQHVEQFPGNIKVR